MSLSGFKGGVIYNFLKEDIQLFLNGATASSRREHKRELLKQKGIPDCFYWVVSDATIDNIAKKLKEKEEKTTEDKIKSKDSALLQ